MKETHNFLVPDYYTQFSCKMGACRSACCQGWPISLSMENYYTLLGMDCPPHLRRRLDCGMHIKDRPDGQSYAQFSPRYDGDCPMRMEDGRCSIHGEMGEDFLPDICRLYPRGIRMADGYECSCANSCEGVLELFLHRKNPITFVETPLTFRMPKAAHRSVGSETMGKAQQIRLRLVSTVQNRHFSLPQRLWILGEQISVLEEVLSNKDAAGLDLFLQSETKADNRETSDIQKSGDLSGALETAKHMTEILTVRHDSIRDFGETALRWYDKDLLQQYSLAKNRFEAAFGDWEMFFEHILVNHMYFAQFPLQDRSVSFREKFVSLCGIYLLVRFVTLGYTAAHAGDETALVDCTAALFRVIDHTDFERYAVKLLGELQDITMQNIRTLLLV